MALGHMARAAGATLLHSGPIGRSIPPSSGCQEEALVPAFCYLDPMQLEDQAPQGGRSEVPRSVLMADIVNSTLMYERLGDLRARELVGSGMEAMASAVSEHGGRLVKSLGDGILACFEGDGATPAGLEISKRVSDLMLEARVGVHHGTVIDDGGDIFGDTVNTAARLASAARPCEVLISKQVWEHLPAPVRELCRSIPSIGVKGKAQPVEVYSILMQEEDFGQTMIQDPVSASTQSMEASTLELCLGEARLVLDGPGSYVIGRSHRCDLRVDNPRTSNLHAKVFKRGSAFMLEDSSTNGTTVLPDSGAAVRIHRRDTALFGRGKIYLGSKPDSPEALAVEYYVS